MSAINLNAYFERIGFSGSIAPTLATLEALHGLHPASIPFETIDPVLGLPVLLDIQSLQQKLLRDRRGGYCFEQNSLFRAILEDLDYTVRAYAARVLWGHPDGAERPLSHMVLVADVGGSSYLCDVGFGSFTLTAPLRLRADVEQQTPNETYRLVSAGEGYRLEVRIGEDWKPVYQFDLVEVAKDEIERLNALVSEYQHAERRLVASRAEVGLRINLLRNRLTIRRAGEEPEQRRFQTIGEIKDTLANVFGIALPNTDLLDPALVRVIETALAEEEAAEAEGQPQTAPQVAPPEAQG